MTEEIPAPLANAPVDHLIVVYSHVGGVGQTTVAVNLADTLARQARDVLLIDWDERSHVASALGVLPTSGLRKWLRNDEPGGSRLGYDRFIQATATDRLWVLSGYLPVADAPRAVIEGHLYELLWASTLDYVICDVAARQTEIAETLLMLLPGTVIIPVAMDNMDLAQVQATFEQVRAITPDSQLILQPTFFHARWKITVANLDLLKTTYPGSVMAPLAYRPQLRVAQACGQTIYQQDRTADVLSVFTQLTRWIQMGPDEILFGV